MSEPPLPLYGPSVHLRHPTAADRDRFAEAVERSRTLLRPWVDTIRTDPDSLEAWFATADRPTSQRLLVVRTADGVLAGAYNLSQIFHGPFRGAYLGYYAFEPVAGTGAMTEGMGLLQRFAFTSLGLHRLQANVQPGNERSIRLLERTGWTREGFARRYLWVDGDWRDHVMFAVLAEDLGYAAGGPAPPTPAAGSREVSEA